MRINNVEAIDDRYAVFTSRNNFQFIDYTVNPTWVGMGSNWDIEASRDNGANFKTEKQYVLWGSYFFLSEEMVVHSRTV